MLPTFLAREVLPAVEAWDVERVSWIFNPSDSQRAKLDEDTTFMQDAREDLGGQLPFFKAIQSCKSSLGDISRWSGDQLVDMQKSVEDTESTATLGRTNP